jgi:hypothetical protein
MRLDIEQGKPYHHLEHKHAKCPPVHSLVVPLALEELRRDVLGGSTECCRVITKDGRNVVCEKRLGIAEYVRALTVSLLTF